MAPKRIDTVQIGTRVYICLQSLNNKMQNVNKTTVMVSTAVRSSNNGQKSEYNTKQTTVSSKTKRKIHDIRCHLTVNT